MERMTLWEKLDDSLAVVLNNATNLMEQGPWGGNQWDDLTMATDSLREAATHLRAGQQAVLQAKSQMEEARLILGQMNLS